VGEAGTGNGQFEKEEQWGEKVHMVDSHGCSKKRRGYIPVQKPFTEKQPGFAAMWTRVNPSNG